MNQRRYSTRFDNETQSFAAITITIAIQLPGVRGQRVGEIMFPSTFPRLKVILGLVLPGNT